jgi:hypothetical protein
MFFTFFFYLFMCPPIIRGIPDVNITSLAVIQTMTDKLARNRRINVNAIFYNAHHYRKYCVTCFRKLVPRLDQPKCCLFFFKGEHAILMISSTLSCSTKIECYWDLPLLITW